jgi:hypothetical protein
MIILKINACTVQAYTSNWNNRGGFTILKLQNSTLVVLSMTVQVAHSLFIEDGSRPFQKLFEFIRGKPSQHEKDHI